MAWYMDESLPGMRVLDVMRAVDYTLSRRDVAPGGVNVHASGAGAIWALFAGALDERIASITAERMLLSYRKLTASDRYRHDSGSFVKDILLETDLPHVAALMTPRQLKLVDPVDALKRPVPRAEAQRAYGGSANVTVATSSGTA
jgi:hypothetical protein